MGDGQISSGEQNEDAFALALPDMHFPEYGDIIEPGIGSGVGGKDDAVIKAKADAVGHDGFR